MVLYCWYLVLQMMKTRHREVKQLSKVTQLVSASSEIQTQVISALESAFKG